MKVGSDSDGQGGILGSEACDDPHIQSFWDQLTSHIVTGAGEDDVPASWKDEKKNRVQISDSDINLFVSRVSPNVLFDSDILTRIIDKVADILPIHIEILLVGFLEKEENDVGVADLLTMAGTQDVEQSVEVSVTFFGSPVGTIVVPIEEEQGLVAPSLLVSTEARYDREHTRYDSPSPDRS